MNEALGPQTAENGYKSAGVIENGKIVSALGGGVCQVTTTMYNAAIFAELKIVERHNHSLMVGYVPLGRDAAVAGTYKNLRFQNDTEFPVYIEAYIEDYNVVCNIYGHEIHDEGHRVDFEKVWVSTIGKPAAKITNETKRGRKRKATVPAQELPLGLPNTENEALFEALRKLRKRLADEEALPAYIVLSDKVLHLLSTSRPTNLEEFGNISGIGEHKKKKYGKEFINLIRKYSD